MLTWQSGKERRVEGISMSRRFFPFMYATVKWEISMELLLLVVRDLKPSGLIVDPCSHVLE